MENNLWSILGYFLGYGFSFVVCLLKGGKTMKVKILLARNFILALIIFT